MRAAVLRSIGDGELDVVDDVEVGDLRPGTVRVAMKATGICHSDLTAMQGRFGVPTPVVLGHEGAGEVTEVGPGVTGLAVGDHVIATGVSQCGHCRYCLGGQGHLCVSATFAAPNLRMRGETLYALAGIGTFSEGGLLDQEAAIRIPPDVPWDVACIIGCGVATGVGAALNAARVTPGSSVVVIGCGGVGASVVQGARVAGAALIVAVDPVESKRALALRLGATHAATPDQLAEARSDLTGDGFDYGFEAVGSPATIRAAFDALRRGGTAVAVGVGSADDTVAFDAYELAYQDKTLRGTWLGSGDPRVEFPRIVSLWRAGRLDLESMITHCGGLEDVNAAMAQLHHGEILRPVLTM